MTAPDDREDAGGASYAETIVRGAFARLQAAGDPRAAQLALLIQLQDLAALAQGDSTNPELLSRRQELWDLARQMVAVFHSDDRRNGGRQQ